MNYMEQNYYIKNTYSKFIEIRGEDRVNFLQGLITNDIIKCNNHTPIYSCFLSPQGKFLADFFIVNLNDSYLIERSEEHTSELQSLVNLVCRLLLEKKKTK